MKQNKEDLSIAIEERSIKRKIEINEDERKQVQHIQGKGWQDTSPPKIKKYIEFHYCN